MAGKKISAQFKEGILTNNPVFVQLLGMCSTLAITTTVTNALGMGLSVTAVLICSNILISALRKIIPNQIMIASYIVIISGFVTVVEMLMKAYTPELSKSLGLFIPLIVVNCIILARAEAFASKNAVLPSIIDGVAMGIGYTVALIVLAFIRELFGSGTLLGYGVFGDSYQPVSMLVSPSGAFITLGFIIAAVQKILLRKKDRDFRKQQESGDGADD